MTNLINGYVWAVSEHLPHDMPRDMRRDVAAELRASIADMVEERGDDSAEATRDVLVELGDPALLARRYSGSQRYLIGPRFYGAYMRLLRAITVVVLPLVFVASVVVQMWDTDQSVIAAVANSVGSTLEVAVHSFFWTTLTIALIERSGPSADDLQDPAATPWTPDDLPNIPTDRQISLGDTVMGIAILVGTVAWILWQQIRSVFHEDGEPIPFLNQDLWSGWLPMLFIVIALTIAVEVWKFRVGRWTLPVTTANLVLNGIFATYFVALFATQEVINPAYTRAMQAAGADWDPRNAGIVVVVVVVVVVNCVWDSIDGVVKYQRLRRADADLGTERTRR